MSERRSEGLEKVYAAQSGDELASAYSTWSTDYDRENLSSGYCLPFMISAWVSRHVPRDAGPLLDAGCGTGLSGPAMRALGYPVVEGLDFSEEMLALAAHREAYDVLKRATLGETLPWPDDHFAAFFSTGVFTEGHAPASGLYELCRITRPGGHAVFTVRDKVFDSGGFAGVFERLSSRGIWTPVEESPLFRAYAIDEPDVLLKAYVFRIC
ncbi:class I SAM-dependent methyltransferase [Ciceribacter sp. L1K22]|uniref:class I SAM-dependent DNA methyltransferase n=1 Tax=Ciceribacter sp. L1K22 TaxID=2820275 RepID=UPI001ABDC86B|nr:class I SAM-dependent methyltransferase [Ciceribacter sp. L1K22]MBO3758215.1 class I SAM-dependent methyltransferase [Ciceribacter sp. L1K22]